MLSIIGIYKSEYKPETLIESQVEIFSSVAQHFCNLVLLLHYNVVFGRVQLTVTVTIRYIELINVAIEWHCAIDFSKVASVC